MISQGYQFPDENRGRIEQRAQDNLSLAAVAA